MGSFSVSCVLTGVTIANRWAVLIPLAPARYPGGGRRSPSVIGGSYVCSNEGSAAVFGALTLPILGRVGDYGDLESYEEDANIRFLKKRFGDEFDGFIEGVTRGGHTLLTDKIARRVRQRSYHDKKRLGWDGTLSGCWVAREAWDEFSVGAWNENGSPRATVFDDGWLDPENLRGLGFSPGPKDEGTARAIFGNGPHEGDRYNTPYVHPELPDFIVWCDEGMSSLASYQGKKAEIGLTFQPFLAGLRKLGIALPESSLAWAKETSIYRGHLLKARNLFERDLSLTAEIEAGLAKDPQKRWRRIKEGSDETADVYCSRDPYTRDLGKHFHVTLTGADPKGLAESFSVTPCPGGGHDPSRGLGRVFTPETWDAVREAGWKPRKRATLFSTSDSPYMRGFPEETTALYRSRWLSDEFLPLTEKILTFEGNMFAANRLLSPTTSGWQCGNDATEVRVAKMALKLAKARANRFK